MRRLIITEKPSVARAIAQIIGTAGPGGGREYIDCGDTRLTWCFGHLLEMVNPEDYDPKLKSWRDDLLPIVPQKWRVRPKDAASAARVKCIGEQLRWAETIVHAGDPDREGQMIVDEVLGFLGIKKPVERIWLASLDEASIRKAIEGARPNKHYAALYESALARARADWLYGINLTRAMTCAARAHGADRVISVGRVQTPTLALVVARDLEIEKFCPVTYFVPVVDLVTERGERFKAVWTFADESTEFSRYIDAQGRILDERLALGLLADVGVAPGPDADGEPPRYLVVREFKERRVSRPPPLPHSLSSLQKECSGRYSATASGVLEVAQRLYEDRVQTYPRTDCRYLPAEQFSEAGDLLGRLATHEIPGAREADPARRSGAWNTGKVMAHHAIIPTGNVPPRPGEGLPRRLFESVALGYIRQFYLAQVYLSRTGVLDNPKPLAGSAVPLGHWSAKGRVTIEPGWTAITGGDARDDGDGSMPALSKGDRVRVLGARVERRHTTAFPRFTDGTLIEAMASVHKFVENPKIKARLKESSGIGTEATRASILETLLHRNFLSRKGKALVSTQIGREVISVIPKVMSDPGITALWEDYLAQVSDGRASGESFCEQIAGCLPKLLGYARAAAFKGEVYPCAVCGQSMRRLKGKKSGKFFWACSAEFGHPRRSDNKGVPGDTFGAREKEVEQGHEQ